MNKADNIDLRIMGYSKSESPEEAANMAYNLRENLMIIFGANESNYLFTPEIEASKVSNIKDNWKRIIKPYGSNSRSK